MHCYRFFRSPASSFFSSYRSQHPRKIRKKHKEGPGTNIVPVPQPERFPAASLPAGYPFGATSGSPETRPVTVLMPESFGHAGPCSFGAPGSFPRRLSHHHHPHGLFSCREQDTFPPPTLQESQKTLLLPAPKIPLTFSLLGRFYHILSPQFHILLHRIIHRKLNLLLFLGFLMSCARPNHLMHVV